jgi:hypothetical protein
MMVPFCVFRFRRQQGLGCFFDNLVPADGDRREASFSGEECGIAVEWLTGSVPIDRAGDLIWRIGRKRSISENELGMIC